MGLEYAKYCPPSGVGPKILLLLCTVVCYLSKGMIHCLPTGFIQSLSTVQTQKSKSLHPRFQGQFRINFTSPRFFLTSRNSTVTQRL